MSEPTAFGAALQALREDRGWSQGELARRAGLSHGHISRMESGWRTPTAETIDRLAAALGLDDAALGRMKRLAGIPPAWAMNPHPLVERLAAVMAAPTPHPNRQVIAEVVETAIRRAERLARGGDLC